jgi:predicted CXXCH cytochrome family protein
MIQKILHLINKYILFFMTGLLLAIITPAVAVEPPKNPNSAKGCAICHYRWIDTFFIEGKGSELVEYESEKVVATPEMCFSCHDGSVKDSRVRMINGNGHKTNMPPPDKMKIPEIFPLDEDGKVQCATCHTAHGVPSGPDSQETIFMRTSNKDSAMCRECHPDKTGGIVTGNHPMGTSKQPIAKKLIDGGAITGGKKNQMICETCHTAHGSPYESLLIDGAGNSALCLDCHGDKNILTPEGKRNTVHVINVEPKKAKIPASFIQRGAKIGYNGIITCQSCHKVHNNNVKKQLLVVENDEKSTFCLICHSDKQSVTNTKHNLMRSAPREKNLEGKTAAEAGVCSACHLPHRTARTLSGEKDFSTQLCMSCHEKGNVAAKKDFNGSAHPLNVNPFKNEYTRSGLTIIDVDKEKLTLPLFSKFGVQDKNGHMTCSTCHNPHESRTDPTQRKIEKSAKENKTTYFLRKKAPDICGECHGKKFSIANSKHDLFKVVPESKNILNQTPSESGLCGSCHAVHGGNENFMWAREITAKSGSIQEDLCMSCHNEKGISKKKIIIDASHALNISPAEKGLNTTLPLFQQNGKISKNGVMTCSTCHDPHRWNPLKTFVGNHFDQEGNSQNSFLRLENSPSPKLCENCHSDKAYVEKTDHDLSVTAPFSKNIIHQTPLESGVCGVCHIVHGDKKRILLWAQTLGSGSSIMETLCLSCHSQNGSAKNRIPEIFSHPKDKLILNVGRNIKGKPDFFPIFDDISGKQIPFGNISCPSCHNAHQWNSRIPAKGKGINVDGDATNSFLRSQAMQVLCKDCHGPDTLLRIKFFHDPRKRTHDEVEVQTNKWNN